MLSRYCIIFFSLFPLTLYTQNLEIQLSKIKKEFQYGDYCKVIDQLETINLHLIDNQDLKINLLLLFGESLLEIEQWEEINRILAQIENYEYLSTTQDSERRLILARQLEAIGDFSKADSLFQSIKPRELPVLLKIKWNTYYGIFLMRLDKFTIAEKHLLEAISSSIQESPITALTDNYLGFLYYLKSRNEKSERHYQKAYDFWIKNDLIIHPNFALLLNDYGLYHINKGKLAEGEELIKQSEAIIKNNNCLIATKLAYNYSAKGDIYKIFEQYEEAEKEYQKALNIFDNKNWYKESATILYNLGDTYLKMDSTDKALLFFEKGLLSLKKVLQKDNLIKAIILNGLAYYNDYEGNYEIADSLWEKESHILEILIGKDTELYATAINNRASILEYYEDYPKAIALYRHVEYLDSILHGTNTPTSLATLQNLARIYHITDSIDLSNFYYEKANKLQLYFLNNYFGDYEETIRLAYRAKAMDKLDAYVNHIHKKSQNNMDRLQNIYLATKNRACDFNIQSRKVIAETRDTTTKNVFKQWQGIKEKINKYTAYNQFDLQELRIDLDSLTKTAAQFEKELIRKLPKQLKGFQEVTYQNIKNNLEQNEACIDFFNYFLQDDYGNFIGENDIAYGAIITRKHWEKPKLIPLTDHPTLNSFFENNTHYTKNAQVGFQLYQLIWQPLEPYLKDIDRIHVSPDGLLHQIAFSGLFTDPTAQNTLSHVHDFYYYSNLRDWVLKEDNITGNQKFLTIGNPTFDNDQFEDKTTNFNSSNYYFAGLPGTKKEINIINKQILNKRKKLISLEAKNASEKNLKSCLKKNISYIHLATHGFFFPKPKDMDRSEESILSIGDRYRLSSNPLHRTGIVLSGVNNTWTRLASNIEQEDGIVTAAEIATLDLFDTQLVVLSACNTGRGDIQDGEGVFGLQRAFKVAGVKNTLISLWKVPDHQTKYLLNLFYKYLLKGKSPQSALLKAQKKMRKKFPPYYWAGFVLYG